MACCSAATAPPRTCAFPPRPRRRASSSYPGSTFVPTAASHRIPGLPRERRMRNFGRALMAALLFAAFGGVQAQPIVIGASTPLTGGVAHFGQHARWGAQLAIDEANAKGGALGRKIEIEFQDNRCNPAEAVKSVSQMLAEKKYAAIFDGLCSSVALAIMPLVERAGVPFIVANASATSIAERSGVGGNKWTFK